MAGEHTGFGIASLVLGILAVATCFFTSSIRPFFIFGFLAIIFGSIAYWGKSKDSFGLAGFILGIVATAIDALIRISLCLPRTIP